MYSLPGVLDVSRVCLALALAPRITSTAGPSENATILSTELMQHSCHVLALRKVCCMTVGWLQMLRLLHIAAYTIRPSRTNNQLAALYVTLHRMGRFHASRPTATSQRSAASRPHLASPAAPVAQWKSCICASFCAWTALRCAMANCGFCGQHSTPWSASMTRV